VRQIIGAIAEYDKSVISFCGCAVRTSVCEIKSNGARRASPSAFDVEPQEAEWLLNVLEQLFDFYFVQPARAKAKRDALNAKLKEAGEPAMKQP
jgi:hypothetical protein